MKVLIFSHSSRLGGAERSLVELVKHLTDDYRFHCTVILQPGGPSINYFDNQRAEIIPAPISWWCTGHHDFDIDKILNEMSHSLEWLLNNLEMLRKISPDIILTNTIAIPWGAICALLLEKPHVWMINEFGVLDHGLKFIYPFEEILKIIDQSSDMIITRSHAVQTTLFPGLPAEKVTTIYPSIQPLDKTINAYQRRNKYFRHPDACHLLMIGTLMAAKGQEDAVRGVIELVKHRKQKVELVLAGYSQPKYQAFLQQIIDDEKMNDIIHIYPFQENVFSVLNEADILLVCSKMEAFGRVSVEGMLMGKAVIAARTGGTPEIIQDGNTGLLYSPGDPNELADKIESLINDPGLRKTISQNGYKFAQSTFIAKNFAGKYDKLLSEVSKQPYQPKDKILWLLIAQIQNMLHQKNINQNTLKKQISALNDEILFYVTSYSWRLTRPFRKFTALFRKHNYD